MTREELISLSGQVVNGMLSADGSIITKVIDRTLHKQIAETAVDGFDLRRVSSCVKDLLTPAKTGHAVCHNYPAKFKDTKSLLPKISFARADST